MNTNVIVKPQTASDAASLMNTQYGCGPVPFAGTGEALYERHLLFDNGVDLSAATARDRFEALARSVRDILSQRWLLTEQTYKPEVQAALYLSISTSSAASWRTMLRISCSCLWRSRSSKRRN